MRAFEDQPGRPLKRTSTLGEPKNAQLQSVRTGRRTSRPPSLRMAHHRTQNAGKLGESGKRYHVAQD